MEEAKQVAVSGYKQVLEDGPDVCNSESDSDHSDHVHSRDAWTRQKEEEGAATAVATRSRTHEGSSESYQETSELHALPLSDYHGNGRRGFNE
jgi:hypothetical protein